MNIILQIQRVVGIVLIGIGVVLRFSLPEMFWPKNSFTFSPNSMGGIEFRTDVLAFRAACDIVNLMILSGILLELMSCYSWIKSKNQK